jgi:hypothetical protein
MAFVAQALGFLPALSYLDWSGRFARPASTYF